MYFPLVTHVDKLPLLTKISHNTAHGKSNYIRAYREVQTSVRENGRTISSVLSNFIRFILYAMNRAIYMRWRRFRISSGMGLRGGGGDGWLLAV